MRLKTPLNPFWNIIGSVGILQNDFNSWQKCMNFAKWFNSQQKCMVFLKEFLPAITISVS